VTDKKARIRLTQRDEVCLKFVVEQGFATIEQLWKIAWSDQKNSAYTYNRILHLEKSGFVKSVKISDSPVKIVSSTLKSRNMVALNSSYPTPFSGVSPDLIHHQLDLNDLRILFEDKGLTGWRSAETLIIDPGFKKLGSRHVPDAFYVSTKGVRTAIEYDRTIRKKDRIKERLSLYLTELMSPDRNMDRLIYLVAPAYLKIYQQVFQQNFQAVQGMFIFTTLEEFKKQLEGVSDGPR